MDLSTKRSVWYSPSGWGLVFLTLLALPAFASEGESKGSWAVTPMDIATMEYVSEVQLSPDGVTAAFVRWSGRILIKSPVAPCGVTCWSLEATGKFEHSSAGSIRCGPFASHRTERPSPSSQSGGKTPEQPCTEFLSTEGRP